MVNTSFEYDLHIDKAAIGKYTVIRTLGQGGEGRVYLARDEALQRLVAVKQVIQQENDSKEEKRLVKEADFLQQLKHPMLPVIYDLLWDDAWYLVLEYIQGTTLRSYIEQNGYVEEGQALAWAESLLDILEYLHTRKPPVIYQDLKPDNIMVCPDGSLKLVDFGATFRRSFGHEQDHVMAATLGYAAPEQSARSGTYADERSDIYAFGKVLYYIVTAADPVKPPYATLSVRDYQPLLSDRLERLIRKCIRDEATERYQVVADIRRDLARCGRRKYHLRRRSFIREVENQIWLTEG